MAWNGTVSEIVENYAKLKYEKVGNADIGTFPASFRERRRSCTDVTSRLTAIIGSLDSVAPANAIEAIRQEEDIKRNSELTRWRVKMEKERDDNIRRWHEASDRLEKQVRAAMVIQRWFRHWRKSHPLSETCRTEPHGVGRNVGKPLIVKSKTLVVVPPQAVQIPVLEKASRNFETAKAFLDREHAKIASQMRSSASLDSEHDHNLEHSTAEGIVTGRGGRQRLGVQKSAQSEPWLVRKHDGLIPDTALSPVEGEQGHDGGLRRLLAMLPPSAQEGGSKSIGHEDPLFQGFQQTSQGEEEMRPGTPTFLQHKPRPPASPKEAPAVAEKRSFMRRALDWTSKILGPAEKKEQNLLTAPDALNQPPGLESSCKGLPFNNASPPEVRNTAAAAADICLKGKTSTIMADRQVARSKSYTKRNMGLERKTVEKSSDSYKAASSALHILDRTSSSFSTASAARTSLPEKSSGSHTGSSPSKRSLNRSGASLTRSAASTPSAEKVAASFHYHAAAGSAGFASQPAPAAAQMSSFSFTQGTSTYSHNKAAGGNIAKDPFTASPSWSSALSGPAAQMTSTAAANAARLRAATPSGFYRNQVLLGQPAQPVRGFLSKCNDSRREREHPQPCRLFLYWIGKAVGTPICIK
ncbi:hypothetical protein CEUSTIGMA_g7300.t1 [Chlamydomonas eustigma]|uniref:Uncharacterized protein n=1 Tax=Chlamydomonas eustigma TaxID=1157962 RepID=A0A250XAS9_9CHLO|nr:hypothetical protein CEUSTIGMA_g7300.t1 [Chlamydomonas eustigma]|eukprot:GAX79860.1 hypothetical protein CEUSTIGMA_g7300.t1 [Chlamydomonas eustigma]